MDYCIILIRDCHAFRDEVEPEQPMDCSISGDSLGRICRIVLQEDFPSGRGAPSKDERMVLDLQLTRFS